MPLQERTTRLTALHIGIIVALMAVVILTYAALTVDYYSWELEFSLWLQGFSLGRADSLRELLFWVGVREVSGVALLVACVVLWLRRWRLEAIFVALVSVPDLLNILIKELIGRPRPTADMVEVVIGYGGIQGSGFPSGHAVHVVLFYGFLLILARLYIHNPALVRTIFALGIAYMLATGPWLIYDGRHWLVDVLGGYSYGAFYLLALIAAYNRVLERIREGKHPRLFGLLHPTLRRPREEAEDIRGFPKG